jgi:hypothetical protein
MEHVRNKRKSIFIWIGQICIDQTSVREKGKQIPLMGISVLTQAPEGGYEAGEAHGEDGNAEATSTVIWLGDEGHNDPRMAFDMLHKAISKLQHFEGIVKLDDCEHLQLPALYPTAAPAERRGTQASLNKLNDVAMTNGLSEICDHSEGILLSCAGNNK